MAHSPSTDVLTPSAPQPERLRLLVIDGPDFGREWELSPGTHVVGKDSSCDVCLSDRAVSGRHLSIEVHEGSLKLVDAGSTNGSFCDGVRFETASARAGAELRVGRTTLKVTPGAARVAAIRPSERRSFGRLVGQSRVVRELFTLLERAAPSELPVLLWGESGTGKELCAHALHEAGPRAKAPFVVLDLAAAQPELLESDLFGHEAGAFTGARSSREGAFVRAHGGTLFLDEIGELPLAAQPVLLRAIEAGEVRPLGGSHYRSVDVRVICATHRDLEADVRAGRFRADLYFRVASLVVRVPPLRERLDDLPTLAGSLLESLGGRPDAIDPETLALLKGYHWPGNVRELRNVLERVLRLGEGAELPQSSGATHAGKEARAEPLGPYQKAKEQLVNAFERDYLGRLLRASEGNIRRAAEASGINRTHLYRMLRKHGLVSADGDEP